MTNDEMAALSDTFRAAVMDLIPADRDAFEELIQETFRIKNIRNVQLWTRSGSQRRNFINRNSSPLEIEMRLALAGAITAPQPPTGAEKSRTFDNTNKRNGEKLRAYLSENYTRESLNSIEFSDGKLTFSYDASSSGRDSVNDEESDEFDDFFDL